MLKWEYCQIEPRDPLAPRILYFTQTGLKIETFNHERDLAEDPQEGFVAVLQQRPSRDDMLARLIAQLGEQGWEMVTCNTELSHSGTIYFKRVKSMD